MTAGFRRWLTILVVAAALAGFLRAVLRDGDPPGDFLRYDRAGALVVGGDAAHLYDDAWRRANPVWDDPAGLPEDRFRYSPSLAVLMAPVGALPPRAGFAIWSALTAACVALGLGLSAEMALRRLAPGAAPWWPAVLAGVPLIHLYTENVKLGQMNCFAFGFSVAALRALDRRRDAVAGLCVAGAVVAKHMPVLLLFWFAWKRRWAAAAWSLGALLAVLYLLPTAVLGPSVHHALLGEWTSQQKHLVTEEEDVPGMRPGGLGNIVEGQSVKALLYRHLTPMPYRHLASKRGTTGGSSVGEDIFVNGSRNIGYHNAAKAWIWTSFGLLFLLLLATAPRRGEDPDGPEARRRYPVEAGLVLLTLLLVSPESRNPHFQMMSVTLAALGAGMVCRRPAGAPGVVAAVATAAAVLAVVLSTRGILGREGADRLLAHGSIGLAALVLFAVSAAVLFAERRAAPAGEAA